MGKGDVWLLLFGLAFVAAHLWAWRQDAAARATLLTPDAPRARAVIWPDGPGLPAGWEGVGPVYRPEEVDTGQPLVVRVAIGSDEALLGWLEGEWVALPTAPGPAGEGILRAEGWAPVAVVIARRR